MVHRTQINNGIWTNEVVYRTSPLGNLDRNIWIGDMSPLQEGFDSDSKACFSVAIDNLTTFALEQRIVGTMSISQSTAMATPFGSMPTIDNIQFDIIIKTSLFKNLLKFIKRNSHNILIEPSTFWFESFQFFGRNISIISDSKIDNFSNNLSKIGIDKIPFIISNSFKLLFGIQGLEFCSPFHYIFSHNPGLLSKIGLIENFPFWRDDADSKMFGIDINSKNILSLLDFFFLRKISYKLQIFGQPECFANPTIINQGLESLIVPILLDWNSNPISWIQSQSNEEIRLGIESLAVSRDVEFNGQTIDFIGFLLPSITDKTTSNLNIKRGVMFAN